MKQGNTQAGSTASMLGPCEHWGLLRCRLYAATRSSFETVLQAAGLAVLSCCSKLLLLSGSVCNEFGYNCCQCKTTSQCILIPCPLLGNLNPAMHQPVIVVQVAKVVADISISWAVARIGFRLPIFSINAGKTWEDGCRICLRPLFYIFLHYFTLEWCCLNCLGFWLVLTRFDFIAVSSKSSRVGESGYMYQPVARRDERRTYWWGVQMFDGWKQQCR